MCCPIHSEIIERNFAGGGDLVFKAFHQRFYGLTAYFATFDHVNIHNGCQPITLPTPMPTFSIHY